MHIISSPRQQSHHYTSSRCFIKKSNGCKLSTSPPGRKKLCLCGITIKHSNSICLCLFDLSTLTQHKHHIWWIFWNILISPLKNRQKLWIILCVKWGRTVIVLCYYHWTPYTVPGICVDHYKKIKKTSHQPYLLVKYINFC